MATTNQLIRGGRRAATMKSKVPALQLDDGRVLSESRAICTYLEGLHPTPNLMGADSSERAFIEMADRRVEWYLMLPLANAIRHQHPSTERPPWDDRMPLKLKHAFENNGTKK